MPPAAKHPPVNVAAHLARTVRAHTAVREGIATHAEKEHVRRQEAGAKLEAERRIAKSIAPSRETLRTRPVVCRDEPVRILGRHLVCRARVPRACDLC